MSNGANSGTSCAAKCWLAGVIYGLLVAAALISLAGWNPLISLVVGAIGTLGAAWVLTSYFCEPSGAAGTTGAASAPPANAVEEDVARKTMPDQSPPSDDAFADEALGEPEPETEVAETSEDGAGGDDGRPMLYTEAPDSPDDLKKIKGGGPALEKTLNDLGIYTFAQVAAWTPEDVVWVDGNLKFKGRIERDDWMAQARALGDDSDA